VVDVASCIVDELFGCCCSMIQTHDDDEHTQMIVIVDEVDE